MMDYRLYLYRDDPQGGRTHIQRAIDITGCQDEAHAIESAVAQGHGGYMELWQSARMVKVFDPSPSLGHD